ncbi:MAG: lysophospholipid acyltransferase family protein [Bacteroidetes bacterium]|nr:lysophospholipid acyltransferase family protein [Bacteroidota bacterium]
MLELTENKNSFLKKFFAVYFKVSLKRNFYRVNVKGLDILRELKDNCSEKNIPVIVCVNHSNWWDGVLLNWISNYLFKKDSYCLMDTVDLRKHRYFNRIGALPLERNNKFNSYRSLKYCTELLKNKNRYLWIFPQGEILPNEKIPFRFFNGISFLTEKLDEFDMLCVFFEYRFTSEQRPEIFVEFFRSFHRSDLRKYSRKELTSFLEELFSEKAVDFAERYAENELKDYEILLQGKKSINERKITRSFQD